MCDQTFDLWQHLKLVSHLKSDQTDTVERGRKWIVYFEAGKTQLVSFDHSNKCGAINPFPSKLYPLCTMFV